MAQPPNNAMPADTNTLLICTVGGSPAPIVASMQHWKPDRVVFVVSPGSKESVNDILDKAKKTASWSNGLQWQEFEVRSEQDFGGILGRVRRLAATVRDWNAQSTQHRTVVDFTGGTKCMAAALTSAARRWVCQFSYVGGARRDKDGLGIVEQGSEYVCDDWNPWDEFGYQAIEEAVAVFNGGSHHVAAELAKTTVKSAVDPRAKRELVAVEKVIRAYVLWDCFQFGQAVRACDDAIAVENDLAAHFLDVPDLIDRLKEGRDRLRVLAACIATDGGQSSDELIKELWLNAMRRAAEGRLDDAVARLYRAVEALAQWRLAKRGIPNTKQVPLDKIPEPLAAEWSGRAVDGQLQLGLQDGFRLLAELKDEVGERFVKSNLADRERSPLNARNQSILAHGFQPITANAYRALKTEVETLLGPYAVSYTPWVLPSVM